MGAGLAAADDRRGGRLHGIDLELRPGGLEHLGAAGDVAAGADAGDQGVEAFGEVAQDLLGRGLHVDGRVGAVLELLRHPRARVQLQQLAGAGDGAFHALLARRQVEAGTIGQHQPAALDAHAVGHHQDQLVALDGRHHGQAHAGIARGRLDDGAARLEQAAGLGVLDHGQRDAILDRAAGVAALRFDPHLGRTEEALHADVGRVADGVEDGAGLHARSPGALRRHFNPRPVRHLACYAGLKRSRPASRTHVAGATRGLCRSV
mmetsp:Transcript_18247/g.43860  ORF Transcript_18247/g.43860 Transcript_18247/m.43860 type:complete len:263 (-) Transcript_18247:592-1380(-)